PVIGSSGARVTSAGSEGGRSTMAGAVTMADVARRAGVSIKTVSNVLTGDPLYTPPTPTGQRVPIDAVRLLAPVIPRSKVVCVGRNYAEHAAELGHEVPEEPLLFIKPNTTVAGPDDPIVLPRYSSEVHHEAELA